jgi:predicted secreted hydrolase
MSRPRWLRPARLAVLLLLVGGLVATGCGPPRPEVELAPLATPAVAPKTDYAPIEFPRDEAPHDVLTEWWYYTGHLLAPDGRRYGFEYVIFQTVRGSYPVLYLGQFAVTDRQRGRFQHANRLSQGSQIGPQDGLGLTVQDWTMRAKLGQDALRAEMPDYAIDLHLSAAKPPALHDDDGLVSFGPAGDSYYYSRTRLSLEGTILDHDEPVAVTGSAWFDHQWGNFLVFGGGWDWISAQLDDGSELMLNHLRDEQHQIVGIWGSYVDPAGAVTVLGRGDFTIEPTGAWTSPRSGGTYPMGWQVGLRSPAYRLEIRPVMLDQELVSDGSGPTYWEGEVEISGTRDGTPVSGLGYVELTGYAPRVPAR